MRIPTCPACGRDVCGGGLWHEECAGELAAFFEKMHAFWREYGFSSQTPIEFAELVLGDWEADRAEAMVRAEEAAADMELARDRGERDPDEARLAKFGKDALLLVRGLAPRKRRAELCRLTLASAEYVGLGRERKQFLFGEEFAYAVLGMSVLDYLEELGARGSTLGRWLVLLAARCGLGERVRWIVRPT